MAISVIVVNFRGNKYINACFARNFRLLTKSTTIASTLAKEIKEEETIYQEIEAPKGWEYKLSANLVTLSKKIEFESVVASFDALNTSKIPYTDQEDPEHDTDDPKEVLPQFACIPELNVRISREGKGIIEFKLNYVEDDDFDQGPYNDEDDADDEPFDAESDEFKPRTYDDEHPLSFKVKNNMWVDIQSVTYHDKEGKIVYTFTNDMFDYEFGCNIIEFLNIRGVDFDFLNSVN
ncbi:hypothetical protein MXB_1373 [Myxobolus squamalis]|nr:hypothetical protein MXB_1373 [Myxobolus squamalis]